ncbi:hypothetical protein [Desulfobacula sp.]
MVSFYKTGIKRVFLYGTALFTGIILLSPFIITWGINTSYIKNKTAVFLYHKTGTHIDVSQFSLAVFPHAGISFHQIQINPDNGLNIFIDFLKFNIDIRQLLQGNIIVDQIRIDRPEIKFEAINQKEGELGRHIFALSTIKDLKKIFTFFPKHQTIVNLKFNNARSQYFKQMDGTLYLSKEKQEIHLNTQIKKIKFKPSILSDTILETYLDLDSIEMDHLTLNADMNSKGEIQGNCTFISPKILYKNKDIILDSNIIESSFKLSENQCEIVIDPFKLNHPKARIAIEFKNNHTQKKTQLRFAGTKVYIDQARLMSLKLFKDNKITQHLFHILRAGVAPNVVVSFKGNTLKNLFKADHLNLKGTIENGLVFIPATNLMASHVFGKAGIHNGILDINTTHAEIQNSKIEKGTLSIDLLNADGVPFQGEFDLDIDLSLIPQTLIGLLPGTPLARELSLVHDVKGRSKALLTLLMEPDNTKLKVEINAGFFSGTGRYDRIPGIISLENTNFIYEPNQVSVKNLNASINGSKINYLNAQIDFKDDPRITIQSGSGSIDLKSTIPWLMSYKKTRQMISPVKKGKGKIGVSSIKMSGPILKPGLWNYEVKGSGTQIHITTQSNKNQIENLSGQYHLSNDFFDAKKINMKINDLSWMGPIIQKKHMDSLLLPIDMENGEFQLGKTRSFFKTDLKFAAGPEVHMDLKGRTPASFALSSIKIIDNGLSNVVISFNDNKDKPKLRFNGYLDTSTLNKLIIPNSFWAKEMKDLTHGQSILFYTDKDSNLNITTQTIDLTSIMAHPKITSMDTLLLPDKIIHFKADQATIKEFTISHIDTDLDLKKEPALIKLNKAFLCDLEASGHIKLKKDTLSANIFFTAKDKPNIQDLFTCLLGKNDFMDGQYSLTGNLTGKGLKTKFLHTLTGTAILNAQNGRIYKLTLLSRILSVLNVSKFFKGKIPDVSQNGFAYNKISLEANIKDSKIYLNKAIIDGQDMTLIFSGWIDPLNDTLDLTCLVAPFKTIDLIIKKIPIINTLLDGRLVSVPVQAMGKLSDPTVVPLHPSAVGKGLITMMTDILKTPVKLLDKVYDE